MTDKTDRQTDRQTDIQTDRHTDKDMGGAELGVRVGDTEKQ